MTKQEISDFSSMYSKVKSSAYATLRRICEDYPDVIGFSTEELEDSSFIESIDEIGIYITIFRFSENVEYDFPISILTDEGFKKYIELRT